MPDSKCSCCHSSSVVNKAVELRQINTVTMVLASSMHHTERECLHCGHIEILESHSLTAV
ncbi:hypothetical protein [Vampirovibrio chlorellavorus]|uniref:hypothetical protein n=1 Tax=Vampirovibrio chlorellavorus TaxID=758823 RepID=UPI0026EC2E00|nr:hypothetical protein [Vampirovibrio chlorellavorus]